jgi:hypothetical protein
MKNVREEPQIFAVLVENPKEKILLARYLKSEDNVTRILKKWDGFLGLDTFG